MTSDPVQSPGVPVGTAGLDPQTSAPAVASRDADRAQIKRLAQEFEAMLMTQMLREMRRSMASDDEPEGGGLGRDMMTDTIDVQLGQALSRAGGIGLSSVLLKALERTVGAGHPSTVAPAETAPAAPVALPARPLSPSLEPGPGGLQGGAGELQVPDGQVTSGYGWRRDPFTGAPRFHAGIDVARAYGQDVQAAAAGRVMFTGDRGAYGTMIVVEHGQGRQTRYAHLSGISVKPGDAVEAGQVIGQSGDSGRTTGPHLHFEVTTSGQAVDPAAGQ